MHKKRLSKKKIVRLVKQDCESILVADKLITGREWQGEFAIHPISWKWMLTAIREMANDEDFSVDLKYKGHKLIPVSARVHRELKKKDDL